MESDLCVFSTDVLIWDSIFSDYPFVCVGKLAWKNCEVCVLIASLGIFEPIKNLWNVSERMVHSYPVYK